MDEPRAAVDAVLRGVLLEVVPDAFRRAVDGVVDLGELDEAAEVGMPVEQLVEGFVDDGGAQPRGLELQARLFVDLTAAERQCERLVQRLATLESGDDLTRQLAHRPGHALPPFDRMNAVFVVPRAARQGYASQQDDPVPRSGGCQGHADGSAATCPTLALASVMRRASDATSRPLREAHHDRPPLRDRAHRPVRAAHGGRGLHVDDGADPGLRDGFGCCARRCRRCCRCLLLRRLLHCCGRRRPSPSPRQRRPARPRQSRPSLESPRPAPLLEGLVNADGTAFSLADHAGSPTLVFFGYTHCPDVCPATIGEIFGVFQSAPGTQAVFVSVDPERDTPEFLASWTQYFPEGFHAVTGSPGSVRRAADEYGVKYARVESSSTTGYTMSHTANVYLIDGDGQLRRTYPFGTPAAEMAADIQTLQAG